MATVHDNDRNSAIESYITNARHHTVDILKNMATPHVCAMMRTRELLPHFRGELTKIIEVGGPLSTNAHRLGPELSKLKRKYAVENFEKIGFNEMMTEAFGELPKGTMELDVAIVFGLCKIMNELKRIQK